MNLETFTIQNEMLKPTLSGFALTGILTAFSSAVLVAGKKIVEYKEDSSNPHGRILVGTITAVAGSALALLAIASGAVTGSVALSLLAFSTGTLVTKSLTVLGYLIGGVATGAVVLPSVVDAFGTLANTFSKVNA